MKQRTMMPAGAKGAANKPSFPNQGMPSNPIADKQANLIFIGGIAVSGLLIVAGIVWCIAVVVSGFNSQPTGWLSIAGGVVGIVLLAFIARAALWMSIFGAMMYANKNNGWEATKSLCARAMGFKKLMPGGATTAAGLLIQGHISRGELDEVVKLGEQQYNDFGNDPKQQQNLAPVYGAMGMAFYMQGNGRDAIKWNDRAIEAYGKSMEQIKSKKGIAGKLVAPQSGEYIDAINGQIAVAYFSNANCYMTQQNFRGAKESFRKVIEYANQANNLPEKDMMLSVSKEQLGRLKHA
jgi:hypothetical protein